MILIDTNVISEPLRKAPAAPVVAWLDAQAIETLYLSAISLAELRYGVAALPAGKRKSALNRDLEARIVALFGQRILPFDTDAVDAYAAIRARAKSSGLAIGTTDGYIAATAMAHGLIVATRDVKPFKAAGLSVIDPWDL
ncbi:toxin FitB [Variibacter gotjawalensis]|uniref:Ribonuclease VapC n=1 Tax=Variibacter gotjawalensis TaxID=1333996 RepID=A0A0S3PXE5_9BRAD|nr:type II toxin-antitoxin system VapC family toxin [Variibacter gotjawalensis]NIK46429.1 hypothetical protein [Variibacter gotjawalensis]RZS48339.1 hypothetical protein EV661_0749 [Variibacter gotjawalensis]BAT60599.1 toxin FitB [Variibacter gotjawalensis]